MSCPQLCGSTLFGNSVDNGGKAAVNPALWGTSPTFSFWAKGTVGTTGNLTYALRYLDAVGNILGQSNKSLNTVNATAWTQFSTSIPIPSGTTAVFFETTFAIGPATLLEAAVADPAAEARRIAQSDMNNFALAFMLQPDELRQLFGALAAGKRPAVSELQALFAPARRGALVRSLGWLAKGGVIRLLRG